MRKLACTLMLLICLTPAISYSKEYERGARCSVYGQERECIEEQKLVWQKALAAADARYAKGVSKMMAGWAASGFEDGFISVRYEKIHKRFVSDLRKAGRVWLFEVKGYSLEETHAIEDQLIEMVSVWLYQIQF